MNEEERARARNDLRAKLVEMASKLGEVTEERKMVGERDPRDPGDPGTPESAPEHPLPVPYYQSHKDFARGLELNIREAHQESPTSPMPPPPRGIHIQERTEDRDSIYKIELHPEAEEERLLAGRLPGGIGVREQEEERKRKLGAALNIQRFIRGFLARRDAESRRHQKDIMEINEFGADIDINMDDEDIFGIKGIPQQYRNNELEGRFSLELTETEKLLLKGMERRESPEGEGMVEAFAERNYSEWENMKGNLTKVPSERPKLQILESSIRSSGVGVGGGKLRASDTPDFQHTPNKDYGGSIPEEVYLGDSKTQTHGHGELHEGTMSSVKESMMGSVGMGGSSKIVRTRMEVIKEKKEEEKGADNKSRDVSKSYISSIKDFDSDIDEEEQPGGNSILYTTTKDQVLEKIKGGDISGQELHQIIIDEITKLEGGNAVNAGNTTNPNPNPKSKPKGYKDEIKEIMMQKEYVHKVLGERSTEMNKWMEMSKEMQMDYTNNLKQVSDNFLAHLQAQKDSNLQVQHEMTHLPSSPPKFKRDKRETEVPYRDRKSPEKRSPSPPMSIPEGEYSNDFESYAESGTATDKVMGTGSLSANRRHVDPRAAKISIEESIPELGVEEELGEVDELGEIQEASSYNSESIQGKGEKSGSSVGESIHGDSQQIPEEIDHFSDPEDSRTEDLAKMRKTFGSEQAVRVQSQRVISEESFGGQVESGSLREEEESSIFERNSFNEYSFRKFKQLLQDDNINNIISMRQSALQTKEKKQSAYLKEMLRKQQISPRTYQSRRKDLEKSVKNTKEQLSQDKRKYVQGWKEIVNLMKQTDKDKQTTKHILELSGKKPKISDNRESLGLGSFDKWDEEFGDVKRQLHQLKGEEDTDTQFNKSDIHKKRVAANKLLNEKEKAINEGVEKELLKLEDSETNKIYQVALDLNVKQEIQNRVKMAKEITLPKDSTPIVPPLNKVITTNNKLRGGTGVGGKTVPKLSLDVEESIPEDLEPDASLQGIYTLYIYIYIYIDSLQIRSKRLPYESSKRSEVISEDNAGYSEDFESISSSMPGLTTHKPKRIGKTPEPVKEGSGESGSYAMSFEEGSESHTLDRLQSPPVKKEGERPSEEEEIEEIVESEEESVENIHHNRGEPLASQDSLKRRGLISAQSDSNIQVSGEDIEVKGGNYSDIDWVVDISQSPRKDVIIYIYIL